MNYPFNYYPVTKPTESGLYIASSEKDGRLRRDYYYNAQEDKWRNNDGPVSGGLDWLPYYPEQQPAVAQEWKEKIWQEAEERYGFAIASDECAAFRNGAEWMQAQLSAQPSTQGQGDAGFWGRSCARLSKENRELQAENTRLREQLQQAEKQLQYYETKL